MLIKYKPKYDHVKCVPLIPDPKDPKSYNRDTVQLLPGTNEITDDEWEAVKPHLAAEIKAGEITVITVEAKPGRRTPDGKARSIKDVPVSAARDIIERCVNPATLKKWFADEARDEVLLLVTKRMRKLKIDPDEIEKETGESGETEEGGDNSPEDSGGESAGERKGRRRGGKKKGGEKPDPATEAAGDDPEDEEGPEDEDEDEIPGFDKAN